MFYVDDEEHAAASTTATQVVIPDAKKASPTQIDDDMRIICDEANASLDVVPTAHHHLQLTACTTCCAGGGCGNAAEEEEVSTPSSAYRNVGIALFVALLGLPEGYFFAHSGLYAPATFTRQMRFENFILLKIFVSGVGTSMLAQALMAAFHVKQFEKSRSYRQDNNGWLQVVGGCGLLGVGMAVSGSGPTMLPTQLGAGIDTAGMVLVGCLVGGALYALVERFFAFRIDVSRHISDMIVVEDLVHVFISEEKIHSMQQTCSRLHLYQILAVPMGLMMIGFAFIVDYLSPHSVDAEMLGLAPYSLSRAASPDTSSSSYKAQMVFFHPIMAGIVLGVNQIPLRFIQDDGQGGSTAIMNMVSYFSSGKLSARHNIKSWKQGTQIIYVYVGTLIGAVLGFMEIGITTHTSPAALRIASLGDSHWTPWRVFLGGMMMVFGARVAGGCTCGHGISGVSELSLQSFAGAAAIFGCGIAITFAIGL